MIPFPNKKYKIIYADPPWTYTSDPHAKRGIWGLAKNQYDIMTIKEIEQLPVKNIADNNCILFLWATFPLLPQAFQIIRRWGFKYKTVAFVWVKKDKQTFFEKRYGLGWYTRSNAEIVLLGIKGKFERKSASVQQIIKSTIQEHSKKPNEVRNRIIELCGDLPRIELFARTNIDGWDSWGNDHTLQLKPLETFIPKWYQ